MPQQAACASIAANRPSNIRTIPVSDAYPLKPFRIRNRRTLCAVIRAFPLATLISGSAGNATMTLIPLLVDHDAAADRIVLTGHLDRNSAHAQHRRPGAPISFHIAGPDAYASPDLYPDPQLPGWLYVAVQGDGEVSDLLDMPDLRAALIRSTEEFGALDQKFALDPADPRIDKFLPGIVGFRIAVTRVSGIAKLAQDKGPAHARTASDFLAGRGNAASADLFAKLLRETL